METGTSVPYQVGFATDVGRKRQQNQDSGIPVPDLGLFVVADGMGGHKGGETASAKVVEVLPTVVRQDFGQLAERKLTAAELLRKAVLASNQAILDHASANPQLKGMGTTTTAILFHETHVSIAQVGDSRCYFFRKGQLWQLTRDHSLVQEKFRAGLITREQMRTDQMKNVITRSVGYDPDLEVDVYGMSVEPGDAFLLCSDGLTGMVDDLHLREAVDQYLFDSKDAQTAVTKLIEQANQNGGDDNVTALLVQFIA